MNTVGQVDEQFIVQDVNSGRGQGPGARDYLKERCPATCNAFSDQLGCSTINRRHINIAAGNRQEDKRKQYLVMRPHMLQASSLMHHCSSEAG